MVCPLGGFQRTGETKNFQQHFLLEQRDGLDNFLRSLSSFFGTLCRVIECLENRTLRVSEFALYTTHTIHVRKLDVIWKIRGLFLLLCPSTDAKLFYTFPIEDIISSKIFSQVSSLIVKDCDKRQKVFLARQSNCWMLMNKSNLSAHIYEMRNVLFTSFIQ